MNVRMVDFTNEEIAKQLAVVEPLTDSVRALIDAVIRTEVDDDRLNAAKAKIDEVVADLTSQQMPGSYGLAFTPDLEGMPWGNAAVGARNAIAPPMRIDHPGDGTASSEVHLGAAYEGPSGLVHGGVSALLLDQLVGEVVSVGDEIPSFTGTLTVKYLRPTPLGTVNLRAEITGREGRKTFVRGEIFTDAGPTVTAEAVMIRPQISPVPE